MVESYAAQTAQALADELPDEDPELLRLYALLALVRGQSTTLRDVHDAYVLWWMQSSPDERCFVPFDELPLHVQELDRPYMEAIHKAAKCISAVAASEGEATDA